MNDRDVDLKALENADDEIIRKIAADCPSSAEERERMFAMSRKIYTSRTNEREYNNETEVSGVDIYRKPRWHKLAAVAAALMIVTGVTAGGMMLSRNKGTHQIVDSEKEVSTSPFGDLSDFRVRIMSAAIAPSVFEPSSDKKLALTEAMNNAEWTEISTDTPIPDGENQHIYFKKGDDSFGLILYMDGTMYYNTGTAEKRYKLDEESLNVINKAVIYEPEAGDKLITIEYTPIDSVDPIWQDIAEPEVNTEPVVSTEKNEEMSDVYFPPLNAAISVPTKNCSFFLGEWDEATAFSCEKVPELAEVFGNVKWNKETAIPDYENSRVSLSFSCSDDQHIYSFETRYIENSDVQELFIFKCENKVTGDLTTDIYNVSAEDDIKLNTDFVEAWYKVTTPMLPNEWFSHDKPDYAFISRAGDPDTITLMDDTEKEELTDILISASWEKLHNASEAGDCIYKLRFFAGDKRIDLSICNDNTAYDEYLGKFKISGDLAEKLEKLSDNVWAKMSPENYADKMPANKEEVLDQAIKIYEEALRRYQNYGPEGLDLNIAEGTSQQFDSGNSGWLIYNVNSIEEINDMYHEFFSDRYPENDIRNSGMLFEENGNVYLRPVGKGSNILFRSTEVSEVLYQSDDEIFFIVDNNYDDLDFDGTAKWTEKTLFSVVVQPDGSWKVGKFTVPY
ncbi:MAG: hypothetical protein IKI56_09035 [Ruminococcus sp.]|nr:hypothetical protein [Ruminococcus sp.]